MKFLSLFSGIEAASIAWLPLGWECLAVAEIEKFPCSVLKHYYPKTPNLGDITQITEEQIKALGHIDIVVGGFPCQDVSVAGLRRGFQNEDGSSTRSGLFFEAMRVVRYATARFLLLENVPGIYSSNGGRDFASMVGEILGVEFDVPANGWENTGVAVSERGCFEWSTLDAQWFGVPQRRRRMFALADFGDWRSRPPILFIPHSLSGDIAPSRKKGEAITGHIEASTSSGRGYWLDANDCAATIRAQDSITKADALVYDMRGRGDGNIAPTLCTDHARGSSDYCPIVMAHGQVRRLTPRECERLMGFTSVSDYTKLSEKTPDGPRYKSLGNSMVTNCMKWIGERIEMVENLK